MRITSADQYAQRWAAGMGSAQARQKYIEGVQQFQGNPMELAARAAQKYLDNVTRAVQDGVYAGALRAVPKEDWVQACIVDGAPGLARGVRKGTPKARNFANAFFQTWQFISQQAMTMPKDTEDQSLEIVRMTIQALRNAGRAYRTGARTGGAGLAPLTGRG
jgi:hypothetical protein